MQNVLANNMARKGKRYKTSTSGAFDTGLVYWFIDVLDMCSETDGDDIFSDVGKSRVQMAQNGQKSFVSFRQNDKIPSCSPHCQYNTCFFLFLNLTYQHCRRSLLSPTNYNNPFPLVFSLCFTPGRFSRNPSPKNCCLRITHNPYKTLRNMTQQIYIHKSYYALHNALMN